MRIAELACPAPLHQLFDYEIPDALKERVRPGMRVRVPFGPRRVAGVVVSVREGEPGRELKPIESPLDSEPLLSAEMLALADWLARRTCAPPGECFKALLPAYVKPGATAGPAFPAPAAAAAGGFELTPGQAAAVARLGEVLARRRFFSALLFGVPASGKTEVYLRLIREAIAAGGQALFLVPEISLTRPFFDDFSSRAGFPVALWHSQLPDARRREVWLGLREGRVRVVVGARSACLLPFKELRLAVMDEEQDDSYKQEGKAPLYHTRDVLFERARRLDAVLVLGSATPSMETLAAVQSGILEMLRMPERVARSTPPVVRIARSAPPPGRCLSDDLLAALKDRLAKREQAILLVNRRGFSNYVLCRKCGWVPRCPACAIAFVLHARQEGSGLFDLLCHHCGRGAEAPLACGGCRAPALAYGGAGTQKVVAELRSLARGAKILRMDRDTVSKERPAVAEERIYDRFQSGAADILVGTKLVAKGFHFPNVTLVGVVDADGMLHMPDFRAAERTLQLLVQVAGRAGRAEKPGEVLLQSASEGHYAIEATLRGEYLDFARKEMELRRELDYPPASTLVRVLLSGTKEGAVQKAAEAAAERFKSLLGSGDGEMIGPAPSVHQKLRGRFRHHLILKIRCKERLEALLEGVRSEKPPSGIRLQVNVDPYDLF